MVLQNLWFVLIALLWMGYFFLEGFDFGIGMLLPFIGKDDTDKRILLNTISPIWDGNEVWLIVAGGATFAAFPVWYATLFSGYYVPLFVILLGLIFRAVGIEFRSKHDSANWRQWWDRAIFWGSLIPSILWGTAFASFIFGVPVTPNKGYIGSPLAVINPYTLVAGLTFALVFALNGSLFAVLKTEGELQERARRASGVLWWLSLTFVFIFLAWSYANALLRGYHGIVPNEVPLSALGAFAAVGWLRRERWELTAFFTNGLGIVLLLATIFLNLYPHLLISSYGLSKSLTIYNSSSSPYTLAVMTIISAIFLPFVLIYQGWSYWIFRQRITKKSLSSGGY